MLTAAVRKCAELIAGQAASRLFEKSLPCAIWREVRQIYKRTVLSAYSIVGRRGHRAAPGDTRYALV